MNPLDRRKDVAREICRCYDVAMGIAALNDFANILIPHKVVRGNELVKEGDICQEMFYVERGLVLQYYRKNGVTVTEHLSHEGDMVICIESYFLQKPSHIIATMLEPGMVFGLPREQLEELSKRHYEICRLIFAIERRSLIISQIKADVLRFETAKERYIRTMQENPEIVRRAPLHHVASFLQMTPETLSRVRAQVNEEQIQDKK